MRKRSGIYCWCLILGAAGAALLPLRALPAEAGRTNLNVVVKDAQSGQPINQAHLTLQFREPRKVGNGKSIAYSAKTNAEGKCRFLDIPKGPIRLLVTAEYHQAFGKDYKLDEDNQVVEVKLKKPQPLL
jgi:ATP phosphoribosyltransferase regulatory subunit HisZ